MSSTRMQSESEKERVALADRAARTDMPDRLLERLLGEECGQDLIEYALVFCLVALGVVASMKSVSAGLVKVFGAVGTTLTTAT